MIKRSLELFDDLASGYSALRNIRNIESTQLIMQSHLSNEFSLFSDKHRKSRVLYYQILCKILFADEDDCESEFNDFMKPFELRLQNLNSLDTIEEFQQSQVR